MNNRPRTVDEILGMDELIPKDATDVPIVMNQIYGEYIRTDPDSPSPYKCIGTLELNNPSKQKEGI